MWKQKHLPPDDVSPLSSDEEPDDEAFLGPFFFSLALAALPLLFSESIVHYKKNTKWFIGDLETRILYGKLTTLRTVQLY